MKTEEWYIVERPTRGIQIFYVKATSKKEARSLVDAHDPKIEALDHEVIWHGRAAKAIRDK